MSVYFIAHPEAKRIKIGVTADPLRRLASLRTGNPDLKMIGWIDGGIDVERDMHRRFNKYRISGEWFTDCRTVRSAIASMRPIGKQYRNLTTKNIGRPATIRHIPKYDHCQCVKCRKERAGR